ncbi:MAG TPA: D-aminoacyl-tRNA deacylase [Patescibacteria group bacterium]|nr:D-aminoacyl-tRNA deacylase [Patescibacteria group bacterium]
MRAVVQRTDSSSVRVEGEEISRIDAGLTVLLGVGDGDTEADARYLADKIPNLRIFPDEAGKMNRSLLDTGGALLVVSQFTLYGDCRKGRRPGFDKAASPAVAEALYETFVDFCRQMGIAVSCGRFQTEMVVSLDNHGPVTLLLDSRREF